MLHALRAVGVRVTLNVPVQNRSETFDRRRWVREIVCVLPASLHHTSLPVRKGRTATPSTCSTGGLPDGFKLDAHRTAAPPYGFPAAMLRQAPRAEVPWWQSPMPFDCVPASRQETQ